MLNNKISPNRYINLYNTMLLIGFFNFLNLHSQNSFEYSFNSEKTRDINRVYKLTYTNNDSNLFKHILSENLFLLSDTLKSHKSIIISIESSKRIFKENSTNKFNTFHLFFKKVIETIDTTYEYKLIVNSSFKKIIIQQKYNDTTYLRPEGYIFFKEFGVYLRIILLYNSELEHNILPNTGKKEDFIELEEILKNITLSKN